MTVKGVAGLRGSAKGNASAARHADLSSLTKALPCIHSDPLAARMSAADSTAPPSARRFTPPNASLAAPRTKPRTSPGGPTRRDTGTTTASRRRPNRCATVCRLCNLSFPNVRTDSTMFTITSSPPDLPDRQLASATTLRDLLIAALANPLLTDGDLADIANAADSQAWMRSELNPMRGMRPRSPVPADDLQSRIIPIQLDQNACDLLSYSASRDIWMNDIMASFGIPAYLFPGAAPAPAEDDAAAPLIVSATPLPLT